MPFIPELIHFSSPFCQYITLDPSYKHKSELEDTRERTSMRFAGQIGAIYNNALAQMLVLVLSYKQNGNWRPSEEGWGGYFITYKRYLCS